MSKRLLEIQVLGKTNKNSSDWNKDDVSDSLFWRACISDSFYAWNYTFREAYKFRFNFQSNVILNFQSKKGTRYDHSSSLFVNMLNHLSIPGNGLFTFKLLGQSSYNLTIFDTFLMLLKNIISRLFNIQNWWKCMLVKLYFFRYKTHFELCQWKFIGMLVTGTSACIFANIIFQLHSFRQHRR